MRHLINLLKWIHRRFKRRGGNIALPRMRFKVISRIIRTGLTDTFVAEISEGDVVIDVGANIGYYSILASELTGQSGSVYAFEPDSKHFAKLVNHLEMNRCRNVVVENRGLSEKTEMLRLYLSEDNSSDHSTYPVAGRHSADVPGVSLDDYCRQHELGRVDFIKIDVQGFEPVVLRGMSETLERNRQVRVLTEFWPNGIERARRDPAAYLAAFEDLGFQPFLVEERKPARPIIMAEAMGLATEQGTIDLLLKRPPAARQGVGQP